MDKFGNYAIQRYMSEFCPDEKSMMNITSSRSGSLSEAVSVIVNDAHYKFEDLFDRKWSPDERETAVVWTQNRYSEGWK